ncbi:MAG: methyltransferase family protein [Gaiellales bacterium]
MADITTDTAAPAWTPWALHLLGSRVIPSFVFTLLGVLTLLAVGQDESVAQMLFHVASAVMWGMFLVLVNIRPAPLRRGRAPIGVIAALSAQFAFIAVGALATDSAGGSRVWIADILLLGGLGFSIVSVLALGRCFGVLPDVRGLVTRGPYRIVRHPLYLGELVSALGLVIGASRPGLAGAAWVACLAVQVVRTRYEEAGLRAEFPEYDEYAEHTRRLIPGVV